MNCSSPTCKEPHCRHNHWGCCPEHDMERYAREDAIREHPFECKCGFCFHLPGEEN